MFIVNPILVTLFRALSYQFVMALEVGWSNGVNVTFSTNRLYHATGV